MSLGITNNELNANLKTEVLVIGAGSGGLVAAIGLAKAGYKVILIEKNKIGGDCTHYGCIPSKALLHKAKMFHDFKSEQKNWLNQELTEENIPFRGEELYEKQAKEVLNYTRKIVAEFAKEESPAWLESFKVDVAFGNANFVDNRTVECRIENEKFFATSLGSKFNTNLKKLIISFDFCVIATGSKPNIPEIEGLHDTPYLTNETIFDLQSPPKKLAILGNGPIGIEMAEAFCHLGSEVTVFGKGTRILPRTDYSQALSLQGILGEKGIKFEFCNTKKITFAADSQEYIIQNEKDLEFRFSHLLVATGRKPVTNINLENAKILYSKEGIIINKQCLTSNKRVYAIGDCCPVPRFTHMADQMGQTVVTHLLIRKYSKISLPIPSFPDPNFIPAVTFTHPEIAQAGYTEEMAIQKFGPSSIRVVTFFINQSDRAKTQQEKTGQIKLVVKGFLGRFIGVHIIGIRAGEMLPEFQRLIQEKKNMLALSAIVRAYPTYSSRMSSVVLSYFISRLTKQNHDK